MASYWNIGEGVGGVTKLLKFGLVFFLLNSTSLKDCELQVCLELTKQVAFL